MFLIIFIKIIAFWRILRWGEIVWKCRTVKIIRFLYLRIFFLFSNLLRVELDCILAVFDGVGVFFLSIVEEFLVFFLVDRMLEGTLIEVLRVFIMLLVRVDRLIGGLLFVVFCGKRLEEKLWYVGGVSIFVVFMVRVLNYRLDNILINVN